MRFIANIMTRLIFLKRSKALKQFLSNEITDSSKVKYCNEEKLVKLLDHAQKTVPYYRGICKKTPRVLSDFPLLTKEIIRKERDQLRAENLQNRYFIKNSTSGSSGEATHLYSDARFHQAKQALALRAQTYTGWKQGEPVVILWGASSDVKKSKKLLSRIINSKLILNTTILSSFEMKISNMMNYYKILQKKKPTLLIGYPSSLEIFSKFLLSKAYTITGLKGIICSGESLQDTQREIIEKAFSTTVYNRYGCREVGLIASECKEHKGLHIASDHVYIEIVNAKGEPCKNGELGEIVVTDLDNYAFPLIRYRIGDLGVLRVNQTCRCGRSLPLLEKVEGRVFDIVLGANGNHVPGNYFTLLRTKIKGFEKFSVLQEKEGEILMTVEQNPDFTEISKIKLVEELKQELGENMIIIVDIIERFPENQNGKHRWIVSKVSPYL